MPKIIYEVPGKPGWSYYFCINKLQTQAQMVGLYRSSIDILNDPYTQIGIDKGIVTFVGKLKVSKLNIRYMEYFYPELCL